MEHFSWTHVATTLPNTNALYCINFMAAKKRKREREQASGISCISNCRAVGRNGCWLVIRCTINIFDYTTNLKFLF